MRLRLQFHPHDKPLHKQLIKLLEKKYAFRAIAVENADWLKNNPGDYVALLELVSYSTAALNDPEFAISQQRLFLAATQRDDDEWNYDGELDSLANELDGRGRPEEALRIFDQLVERNPEEGGFWADRSDALTALGRNKEAAESLRHSISLDPSFDSTHVALARVLLRLNDLDGAEAEYRAALAVYASQYKSGEPTNAFHSMVRGLINIEAQNHSEAMLAEMHMGLASVLALEGHRDSAVKEAEAALAANQAGFEAYYLKAQILEKSGNKDLANKTREEAASAISNLMKKESKAKVDLDPRLLFLSDGLMDGDSRKISFPDEIITILEPRSSVMTAQERFILAYAYLGSGRVREAINQWGIALSHDSKFDTARAHYVFARRLVSSGNEKEAAVHFRRAYELDPQNLTYQIDYENTRQK
jgi:tetratricopeptide (TPR) repeat protein